MTDPIALAGAAIGLAALGVSTRALRLSARQTRLSEREQARSFGAALVAELIAVTTIGQRLRYELTVTNGGQGTARDIDVSIVEWEAGHLGKALTETNVPILLYGERRTVTLELLPAAARFDDAGVSIELHAYYYDDNGISNQHLAFVFPDGLVTAPAPLGSA